MAEPSAFSEWLMSLPDDERARMEAHLERQRGAQAAVKPHAEHREAESRLRAAATVTSDPAQRRDLLRQAHHHTEKAVELVTMIERLANGSE